MLDYDAPETIALLREEVELVRQMREELARVRNDTLREVARAYLDMQADLRHATDQMRISQIETASRLAVLAARLDQVEARLRRRWRLWRTF